MVVAAALRSEMERAATDKAYRPFELRAAMPVCIVCLLYLPHPTLAGFRFQTRGFLLYHPSYSISTTTGLAPPRPQRDARRAADGAKRGRGGLRGADGPTGGPNEWVLRRAL